MSVTFLPKWTQIFLVQGSHEVVTLPYAPTGLEGEPSRAICGRTKPASPIPLVMMRWDNCTGVKEPLLLNRISLMSEDRPHEKPSGRKGHKTPPRGNSA